MGPNNALVPTKWTIGSRCPAIGRPPAEVPKRTSTESTLLFYVYITTRLLHTDNEHEKCWDNEHGKDSRHSQPTKHD